MDIETYLEKQMAHDDELIASQIEVEKIKIGYVKQWNNAQKNKIDAERVEIKKSLVGA